MRLAYVTVPGRGAIDDFIASVAEALIADGLRLAGTVRAGRADPSAHRCDMDLRVLPNGPEFRISQPLGTGSRGCRLDGSVIENIAAAVEARLCGADLLLVNKFGKQEAQGRGLCPTIAMAIELGIPTLVGVNETNARDFLMFSGHMARELAPEIGAVRAWQALPSRSNALALA